MSETPTHHVRETNTLRFARFIVRHRGLVSAFLIATTLFFLYPTVNAVMHAVGSPLPGPVVRVDTSARAILPDHPFVHAQDEFASKFGGSSMVVIGLIVEEGTIFTPEILQKISRITKQLDGIGFESHTEERKEMRERLDEQGVGLEEIQRRLDRAYPPYPVNHYQIQSIAHSNTRIIQVEPDGAIINKLLMEEVPETQEEADELREQVRQNPPYIFGRLVSRDEKGALIAAGFVSERLSNRAVYEAVFNHVQDIKEREETENIHVYVTGEPILRGWVFKHAFEIGLFVVLTIVMTFGLLLAYFRRLHGVLIPFVAAIATAVWGLGFTGWVGINFDPLILVIPMIITARAVSHTVQMAERFFEDYEILLPRYDGDEEKAKVEAATVAMGELIVPGTLGILTDFLGLLVILITSIPQMRDLAMFGAFWVLTILFTVEILHPVMICYLPPPHRPEHYLPGFMVRVLSAVGRTVTHPFGKYAVAGGAVVLLSISAYIAFTQSTIGEAKPGTPLLWPDHEFNVATAQVAEQFGGVDSLVVYANGDRENATADAKPIHTMEAFERFMDAHTNLGASVSLVPFIRNSWRINHYGDPKWQFVPADSGTVRAIIFQLQTNGPPGFLRPFMTDDGKDANISFIYPDHKGTTIQRAVVTAEEFIKRNPLGEVSIRLEKDRAERGAGFFDYERVMDNLYYMLGPLLPPRHHTLSVRVRQKDEVYEDRDIQVASKDGLPEWIGEFRDSATFHYEEKRATWPEGEFFPWPERLGDWTPDDVNQWWEDEKLGLRAVAVNTEDLIVQDLRAVDPTPKYQITKSWTRGMQFVMAGGIMGILAAINDEVERSHVANISLILLVIYVLQTLVYRSLWSGTIIVIQLATATMISLAYMALKGVGLNINTLPVQSVGVGIGVDYAIYIVDRIRQEVTETADIDEAVRRSIRTTGMAVSFTATTIVGGIVLWWFSSLRFQAEMAQLLVILMVINMLGAITVVPAFYSIIQPKFATALLTDEQREALRAQRELEESRAPSGAS